MTGRLERRLATLAGARTLLVVSDFDGTLAPIVDHPDDAAPDEDALDALRALGALPRTHAAVLSGRDRATLARMVGDGSGLALVGSHGAELDGEATADPATARMLARVASGFDELASRYPGALVERKPAGAAFHVRRVASDLQEDALEEARAMARGAGVLDERAGTGRLQPGHLVIEVLFTDASKGDAIAALVERTGATRTVFVGDDRTDEEGFARLGPEDLSVKVGPGETGASVRLAGQERVAPLFRRLLELRRAEVAV